MITACVHFSLGDLEVFSAGDPGVETPGYFQGVPAGLLSTDWTAGPVGKLPTGTGRLPVLPDQVPDFI